MAYGMVGWPCLALVLVICRAWFQAVVARLSVGQVETRSALTASQVRAMSWRLALFLLVALPAAMTLAEAAVGGISFGLFAFAFALPSTWLRARRISRVVFAATVTGQNTLPVSAEQNALPLFHPTAKTVGQRWTLVDQFAFVIAGLMLLSLASSVLLPALTLRAKKPPLTAAQQASSAILSLPEPASSARSTREGSTQAEGRKLFELLVRYGLEREPAAHVIMHQLPGRVLAERWEAEVLPPFNDLQKANLRQQLLAYLAAMRALPVNAARVEFITAGIGQLLQDEQHLTDAELFAQWEAGLAQRPENWWQAQNATLSEAAQNQLQQLRTELSAFLSASPSEPPAKTEFAIPRQEFAYQVWQTRIGMSWTYLLEKGGPQAAAHPSATGAEAPRVVSGKALNYQLSVPGNWSLQPNDGDYDLLLGSASGRIGVMAEEVAFASLEALTATVQQRLRAASRETRLTRGEYVRIDGRSWYYFYAFATVENIPLAYRFTIYTGPEGTFQIICWTGENVFTRYQSGFDEVLRSFKFPPRP